MHYLALFATYLAFISITVADPQIWQTDAPKLDRRQSQQERFNFFTGFKTVYGDRIGEKPADAIRELTGQSSDINYGFVGKFVWICPQYSPNNDDTQQQHIIWFAKRSGNDAPSWTNGGQTGDLAQGAGDDRRYLLWGRNVWVPYYRNAAIVDVALWRSKTSQIKPPSPFRMMTANINEGRAGDYLYVVWS
ncbi:MAG: hypothetical protein LQ342_004220 [Letrouitia transgressa]|nr:MAG: hypothetical protein LQ342_004220 [Letrouitia transgressa]